MMKAAFSLMLSTALATPAAWNGCGTCDITAVAPSGAFGKMGIDNFQATQGDACKIEHNIPATGYVAGTNYTFTISTDHTNGLGMAYRVGAVKLGSAGKASSEIYTWAGSSDADTTVHAICASASESIAYVAVPLTVTADPCDCGDGQFQQNAACTDSASSTCVACTACGTNQFEQTACAANANTVCADCGANCAECTAADTCTTCVDIVNGTETNAAGSCSVACDAGFFTTDGAADGATCEPCTGCETDQFEQTACAANADTVCADCGANCAECIDATNCTTCVEVTNHTVNNVNGSCEVVCEDGFYTTDGAADGATCEPCTACETDQFEQAACTANANTVCVDCGANCAECINADNCTACVDVTDGTETNVNGSCSVVCDDGFYNTTDGAADGVTCQSESSIPPETGETTVVPCEAGGCQVSTEAFSLRVPAGAAPADVDLTAAVVTEEGLASLKEKLPGLLAAIILGPAGTNFSSPVTVCLHVPEDHNTTEDLHFVHSSDNGETWEALGNVSFDGHMLCGEAMSFSIFAAQVAQVANDDDDDSATKAAAIVLIIVALLLALGYTYMYKKNQAAKAPPRLEDHQDIEATNFHSPNKRQSDQ